MGKKISIFRVRLGGCCTALWDCFGEAYHLFYGLLPAFSSGAPFSHRGERETRVTGNEAQWTMGRTKKTREAPFRPFSPSHLPLRANFYPERERRLGTRQDCCRVAGESGPKFSPEHSHSAFRYNTSSKIRAFKELPLNI